MNMKKISIIHKEIRKMEIKRELMNSILLKLTWRTAIESAYSRSYYLREDCGVMRWKDENNKSV